MQAVGTHLEMNGVLFGLRHSFVLGYFVICPQLQVTKDQWVKPNEQRKVGNVLAGFPEGV